MANAFIYSTTGKILRRITPNGTLLPKAGESVATNVIYASSADWLAAVSTKTGNSIGAGRCAVINGSSVVGVVHADPLIDNIAGSTLVLSSIANIGWTWTAGGGFVPAPAGTAIRTRP